MDIICSTTFLHQGVRYEEGDLRRGVSDELGAYFVAQGWAVNAAGVDDSKIAEVVAANRPSGEGADVDLDVQDIVQRSAAEET